MREIKQGCYFCDRCDKALDCCKTEAPEYVEGQPGHLVKCHLMKKEEG
jgi:oligopeptide/dipeptide ABC transporter ATP-binding protein